MDLYRGKSKRSGDWIIGAVVCINDKAYALVSPNLKAERPAYNRMDQGCKLEQIEAKADPHKAMEFGWIRALECYEKNFPIWEELELETVTRCSNKHDIHGNVLFEGDVIQYKNGILYEICYGKYMAYEPYEEYYVENIGFFMLSKTIREVYRIKEPIPIDNTEECAVLVGNVFDNPELSQGPKDEEPQNM